MDQGITKIQPEKKSVLCELCGAEMKGNVGIELFEWGCLQYHAEALVYRCGNCGYEKLGTCRVQFWENDEPEEKENGVMDRYTMSECLEEDADTQKDSDLNLPLRPAMFTKLNGKMTISDEWLDWMLEHKKWFLWYYERFIPQRRKEKRYLSRHQPTFRAIVNGALYDTSISKMYLMQEKDFGDDLCRIYYYKTDTGKFYKIIIKFDRADEFITMEEKEVKKILWQSPEVYREFFGSDFEG